MGVAGLRDIWRQGKREATLDAVSSCMTPMPFGPSPPTGIPRIIPKAEWDVISAGVEQRLKALNLFLLDLYTGEQKVVPEDVIYSCQYFYPGVPGLSPGKGYFRSHLRH